MLDAKLYVGTSLHSLKQKFDNKSDEIKITVTLGKTGFNTWAQRLSDKLESLFEPMLELLWLFLLAWPNLRPVIRSDQGFSNIEGWK